MTQLTLFQLKERGLEPLGSNEPWPKAPPRDPESAETLHEWCQLFLARNGHYPDARMQSKALDDHADWRDATAYAKAKKALRDAIPMRRDRC